MCLPKDVRFAGRGPALVEKGRPKWSNGRVAINVERWFEDVPENVWLFHIGGYQVCEKWLKDRRGRTLTEANILHYRRIVAAISETIRLMVEIDRVIEAHGGWPGAFEGMGS
jgi:Type ISP C-terminal specificity domain